MRSKTKTKGNKKKSEGKQEAPLPSPAVPPAEQKQSYLSLREAIHKLRSFHGAGDTFEDKGPVVPALFKSLVLGTKAANSIPQEEDYKFYETFDQFVPRNKELGARILKLAGRVCEFIENAPGSETHTLELQEGDSLDKFGVLSDCIDNSLEKVDLYIDEMLGKNKYKNMPGADIVVKNAAGASRIYSNKRSLHVMKPQRKFADPVDNSYRPWVPKLTSKPNAITPLPADLVVTQEKYRLAAKNTLLTIKTLRETKVHIDDKHFPHPYGEELARLEYDARQLAPCKEKLFEKDLEKTPLSWVATVEELHRLEALLVKETEFAVDLEHHDYRSYLGLTCLMQISTRSEDFVVDTLALRDDLHILNSSFTDPNIVKVLHGSNMDILWLQRDLGLYVVNLFDTGQCSRVMEFPRFSLAYLLKHYCDVTADKKYQLADWRERPLPAEMMKYARMDTHYLLYIYDRMRNEVLESSNGAQLLLSVLNKSRDLCLQTYEKPKLSEEEGYTVASKIGRHLNDRQTRILQALLTWRDEVARVQDEGPGFIMSLRVAVTISSKMPLDTKALFACCKPVPSAVRQHASHIVSIITEAYQSEEPVRQPSKQSSQTKHSTPSTKATTSPGSGSRESNSMLVDTDADGYVGPCGGPELPRGVPLFDFTGLDVKLPAPATTPATVMQAPEPVDSQSLIGDHLFSSPTGAQTASEAFGSLHKQFMNASISSTFLFPHLAVFKGLQTGTVTPKSRKVPTKKVAVDTAVPAESFKSLREQYKKKSSAKQPSTQNKRKHCAEEDEKPKAAKPSQTKRVRADKPTPLPKSQPPAADTKETATAFDYSKLGQDFLSKPLIDKATPFDPTSTESDSLYGKASRSRKFIAKGNKAVTYKTKPRGGRSRGRGRGRGRGGGGKQRKR